MRILVLTRFRSGAAFHDVERIKLMPSQHAVIVGGSSGIGLASARQVLWLRKLGHPTPELATFEEAKQFLDAKWNKPGVAA